MTSEHPDHPVEQALALDGSGDWRSSREIVRQQWNFSPEGATQEIEDYDVGLTSVTALELRITPDINGGNAIAALRELRLA